MYYCLIALFVLALAWWAVRPRGVVASGTLVVRRYQDNIDSLVVEAEQAEDKGEFDRAAKLRDTARRINVMYRGKRGTYLASRDPIR